MAFGNSIKDIEMRMRQQALARRRSMTGKEPKRQGKDSAVSSTQKAIDDITAMTMQRLAQQGIGRGRAGYSVDTGPSGINVQGSPAVARARSGEKVVVKGEPSTYYSHTETREPATITVGGQPYSPGIFEPPPPLPGETSEEYAVRNGLPGPTPRGGPAATGSYLQGGISGSQAPFPDAYSPSVASDSLITEPNPLLIKGSLASQVMDQMAGIKPMPPPPPAPAPVALAQQAQPQGDIVQQNPNQFFGWQGQGATPGVTMGGSSGGYSAPSSTSFTPTANTGRTGGMTPLLIGGTPGGYIPPEGSIPPPGEVVNMGMSAPTGSSGSGIYQDQLNAAYDAASQQLGVPGNVIKAIQTLETGGADYVGQENCEVRPAMGCVALDSGIFSSVAQSYGLDYNRIKNDPEYAAYATGVVISGIANSDAGTFKGPSGMTVYQWGEQNLGPGGGWVAVARVYYGGDVTGQFVDELGTRTGEQYGQEFQVYVDQFGGIQGSTGSGVQPTGGATTGYQGSGPGGGRDVYGGRGELAANGSQLQQPTYSDQGYAGSGPGGGRDVARGGLNADGSSMQAPPEQAGAAIAANTADPGMGSAIGNLADNYVGTRYIWGGSDPSGWDCSGFVHYIAEQEGLSDTSKAGGIPNGSHYQYEWAKQRGSLYQVSDPSQLQPGDIIFFNTGVTDDASVGGNMNQASHVGIYLGNGKFIQALNEQEGTKISVLNDYWMSQVIGASTIY